MAYLTLDGVDFSRYVSGLQVTTAHNYNAQTNAAGDTVVDYIKAKRKISVEFRPLNASEMQTVQAALSSFSVLVSFRNPATGTQSTAQCITAKNNANYYTIQATKTLFNKFSVEFNEL